MHRCIFNIYIYIYRLNYLFFKLCVTSNRRNHREIELIHSHVIRYFKCHVDKFNKKKKTPSVNIGCHNEEMKDKKKIGLRLKQHRSEINQGRNEKHICCY